MPFAEAASSSSGPSMALLEPSDMDQYADFLHRELSEAPGISAILLRDRLIQEHAVSCLERTMRSWSERARASEPKRGIKRGSSDLPTLENLEEHGDYLRGLLAEDPSMGRHKLREAIKAEGFLVSPKTMENWLDRYHRKCSRALLEAPIEGLPCLDRAGLLQYEEAVSYTHLTLPTICSV